MALFWWAGVAIDPATQGVDAARALNSRIEGLVVGLRPDGDADDGAICIRFYEMHGVVLGDIHRYRGSRIGFGRMAASQEAAQTILDHVQGILNARGVDALCSVWAVESGRKALPREVHQ